MRFLIFLLAGFLFFISACFLLPQKELIVSLQAKDAGIILKKAAEQTQNKNYKFAFSLFQDALGRYTEIDDEFGKMRTLSGLVKLFTVQGKMQQADSICALLPLQFGVNKTPSVFAIDAIAFKSYYSKDNQKLLELFNKIEDIPVNVETKSLVASYIIFCRVGASSEPANYLLTRYDTLLEYSNKGGLQNIETTALAAYALAINSYDKKEFNKSRQYTETALQFDTQSENSRGIADDYYLSGKIAFQLKNFILAGEEFQRAKAIYSEIAEPSFAKECTILSMVSEYKVSRNPALLKSLREIRLQPESKEMTDFIDKYISEATR